MPRDADEIIFAIDRSARTYDKDGRLHVALSHISKANICGYYGREIPNSAALGLDPMKLYQMWRHPDELQKAVATANNIPLLDTHIIVSPDSPEQESVVGSTGTDAAFSDPYLDNSLVIWTDWAIEGVEKREQCQLSCAYRYVAVMQPGEHNGLHYDGIMRDIVFNHVALVPEGRAGPDVVVGDSSETAPMPLTSRKALMALGASRIALRPILATDAKIDLEPAFAGVTSKNFKAATILERITKLAKGKLRDGVSMDAVAAALDAMEEEAVEDEEPEDKGAKDKRAKDKKAMDAKRGKDRKGAMDKMRARDGEPEETEDEAAEREKEDAAEDARRARDGEEEETMDECEARYEAGKDKRAKDRKARDEAGSGKPGDPKAMDAKAVQRIVKAALDEALPIAREQVRDEMRALDQARRDVAPIIGDVQGDTAREVYMMALDSADGVELDGSESLSALRSMVKMLPEPGAVRDRPQTFARDAAASSGFATRFPGAARIGHA